MEDAKYKGSGGRFELVEDQLRKMMGNYKTMLEKLSNFKEEEELDELKEVAKKVRGQLNDLQKTMHSIINEFVSNKEPELRDTTFVPMLGEDIREVKRDLYTKYTRQIEACISAFKNPFKS